MDLVSRQLSGRTRYCDPLVVVTQDVYAYANQQSPALRGFVVRAEATAGASVGAG